MTDDTTILIIDDQPANLAVLVDYLENRDIEVVVAENGANGLARAGFVLPDLILLDVLMPGIDGFETCRLLAENKETAHIPVIFMSALTGVDEKIKGFEAGGVDFVTKPVQLDEVWARIETHLTISRLRANLEEKNLRLRHEIEERTRAEEKILSQNRFLKTIINSLPHPFYVIDAADHTIAMANDSAAPDGKWNGATCHALLHNEASPCNGDLHPCPLAEVRETGKPVTVEHLHLDSSGRKRNMELHAYPIFSSDGRVVQMIEYAVDITRRKQLEENLSRLAITDELTGLHNRRGFMMLAGKYLELAQRNRGVFYLLYADLNNMKFVNDRYGHRAGDELLKEAAALLRETFRRSDIISRIGGDEFAVMLSDKYRDHKEEAVTRRLHENAALLNRRQNRPFELSISVGIARYDPNTPSTIEELLSRADERMYAEKRRIKAEDAERHSGPQ